MLIDIGNFIHPEEKALSLLQHGNGIYDGLELFKYEKGNPLKRMINNRYLEPINVHMPSCGQCYNVDDKMLLFTNAGSPKEISISYELMLVAYQAVLRHDYRSSIIIAATALEKSILKKIFFHYVSNQLTTFEHDKACHRTLGGRFKWLKELKIDIPITDYKLEILDIRNSTAHEGKSHNHRDTMKYLDNCKLLIQKYTPDVLDK